MPKEMPKAYEPDKYEDEIYKKWEESGKFNPDNLDLPADAKNYSIVMPPPNVTGTLHLGHAAMLALEDILTRYHRMKGERVLWIPGTDHAAIATQTKVEKILKEKGLSRHDLGREKFLEEVKKFARQSHDTINMQCKKMGSSCDWSREAYTLDDVRSKVVRSVFKLMYDDGLIFRGDRIVNWCPRCHSTLADDEVEYKEQQNAKFYTFRYDQNFPFTISTTRPETKLGDTAVAVNPKDKRYSQYIGKTIVVDFCGVALKIKIIGDYKVDPAFGTGALGVTPAHSAVDWQMAADNSLEIIKVIDEDGNVHAGFGEYSGLSAKVARQKIVEKLQANGLIEKEEEINNKLSICYRCSTPIEPLPSLQWFINVDKKIAKYNKTIKELSVEAVRDGIFGREKINIIPERFEKNYFHWMDNLRDWCISRQILFGHQVPVWYKNQLKINNEKLKIGNFELGEIKHSKEDIYVGVEAPAGEGWVQDEDTLDTWFSSGLWTFSTLANSSEQIKIKDGKLIIDSEDFRNFHPTNVLETGYDILFFWVARMIIMTTYSLGDIPFQDVYLHGLIKDEKGKKMSKSLGNVIDPLDMIRKYGTDATRLSLVVGSTPGNDMNLNEEKIAGFRNFTNKLWNISRYIISNYQLSPSKMLGTRIINYQFNEASLTLADKWILEKLDVLIKDVSDDLDYYRFSQAGERLREFTWNYLADWYLEVSKFEKNKEKDAILFLVLSNLLKLWHPFMPFVTEKIWQEINTKDMLMVEKWPAEQWLMVNGKWSVRSRNKDGVNNEFEIVINIISAIRNVRAENKINPSQKIKAVIYAGGQKDLVESQISLIKGLRTGIEDLEIKDKGEKIKGAIFSALGEIEIYLIITYDSAKEKEKIDKEIKNLDSLIKTLTAKLANKEFIGKAPNKIIAQEIAKLDAYQDKLNKLNEQLKNI
jgi:valyl-tRNA synthetase